MRRGKTVVPLIAALVGVVMALTACQTTPVTYDPIMRITIPEECIYLTIEDSPVPVFYVDKDTFYWDDTILGRYRNRDGSKFIQIRNDLTGWVKKYVERHEVCHADGWRHD